MSLNCKEEEEKGHQNKNNVGERYDVIDIPVNDEGCDIQKNGGNHFVKSNSQDELRPEIVPLIDSVAPFVPSGNEPIHENSNTTRRILSENHYKLPNPIIKPDDGENEGGNAISINISDDEETNDDSQHPSNKEVNPGCNDVEIKKDQLVSSSSMSLSQKESENNLLLELSGVDSDTKNASLHRLTNSCESVDVTSTRSDCQLINLNPADIASTFDIDNLKVENSSSELTNKSNGCIKQKENDTELQSLKSSGESLKMSTETPESMGLQRILSHDMY